MRLFAAVDLPARIRDGLRSMIEDLQREVGPLRWARPEGIHLTLKFLGETAEPSVARLGRALSRAVTGSISPFELRVAGAGIFPAQGRPRVLWAGLEAAAGSGTAALQELHRRVEEAAAEAGYPRETRPFHPHLTLARLGEGRPPEGLAAALSRQAGVQRGRFTVSSVWLFQSILRPTGAEYRKIEEYPL